MLCRTLLFLWGIRISAHTSNNDICREGEGRRGKARGDRCDWRNQIGIIWIDDDGKQTLT